MKTKLAQYKKEMLSTQKGLIAFLTRLQKYTVPQLNKLRKQADTAAWQQVDCLSCGNCCRSMTPTFTTADITRISNHLSLTASAFKAKWLTYEVAEKHWVNVKQPCQFLDLKTNKCSIYEIRPTDCANFPHHHKKNMDNYMHVYKQNLLYCPITVNMVQHLKASVEKGYSLT